MAVCLAKDDGVLIKNSVQSMMTRVVGYHFLKHGGISRLIFRRESQAGNCWNLTYMRLSHVMMILETVEGCTPKRSARSTSNSPSRSLAITLRKNCSSNDNLDLRPGFWPCWSTSSGHVADPFQPLITSADRLRKLKHARNMRYDENPV